MKIDRNRARKGAVVVRRFSVSPVTRAVRSVLTISAAALAFSGTGLALASAPVHTTQAPAFAAQHADLSQHAAFAPSVPVVDLTLVRDADLPASVVAGDLGLSAALTDADLQYAGPVGPGGGDAFDRVFDLANVQSLVAGPGGGSGGLDDQVFFNYSNPGDFPGNWYVYPHGNNITVTSNTGLADGWFVSLGSIDELDADWTMNINGYTWAAGVELEVATHGMLVQTGDITANATGPSGQAIGVYVSAGTDAGIDNRGAIHANANNAYGIAVGLFAYGVDGDATVTSTGTINANANMAGTATGISSTSVNGNATGTNGGTMVAVAGGYATGVDAETFYGAQAHATNAGSMTLFGISSAYGATASAEYGSAYADNSGTMLVQSAYVAVGAFAEGQAATATNSGTLTSTSFNGLGVGIVAIGTDATATNVAGGTITVSGDDALGAQAVGDTSAVATNGGTMAVTGLSGAAGVYAGAFGPATATNDGTLAVDGGAGDAAGAFAVSVTSDANAINNGALKVSGDNAKGLYAIAYGTGTAHTDNAGTINTTGVTSAYGMYALSDAGDATAHNGNAISVTADGMAVGAFVSGYNASVKNDGDIYVNSGSFISEGVLALGAYTDITNNRNVASYGILAVGLDSEGAFGADVTNNGSVIANGYVRAYGLLGLSQFGDVSVTNTGTVDVDAIGVAYGAYASGAGAITVANNAGSINARSDQTDALGVFAVGSVVGVTNNSDIIADGNTTGAGIYAAGGVVAVDNNGGTITATTRQKDGFAVGVLAAGGDVSVDNRSTIVVNGTYATGIDIRAAYSATAINDSTVRVDGAFATAISVRSSGDGENASATNNGRVYATGSTSVSGIEAVNRAYQGTGTVANNGLVRIYASNADVAQGLVAAGDTGGLITNTRYGQVTVTGGAAAYGALALSADVEASFTNDGVVQVSADGTAFGAVVQGNSGIATVQNNATGYIMSQGDTAYGAYATGLFSHASVDNSGRIYAFGNAGNAFGTLAYSYNNLATTTNDGLIVSGAAGAAVGMESLSLFGDASVSNDGFLYAGGGTRARGEIARSLFGTATTSNDDTIVVRSNGNAYGMWSRGDYGIADATNNGDVDVESFSGRAYGVLSGGYYGATLTNTVDGKIDARGYASAIAAAAYANYGDVTIVNGGSLHASATGLTYGIQALAAFDATVTNTGTISSISGAAVGDGIYANATNVDVTNSGDIVAKGGYWSAGIEGRGDVVDILTTGSIDAYVYDGSAFGAFALANTAANVRNNGPILVTAAHGTAYGEFAAGGVSARTTNGGDITVNALDGVAVGTFATGANVDGTNSGTITANGTIAAIGMGGSSDEFHSVLINHGDISVDASATGGFAAGLSSDSVGYARGINNGEIDAHANDGTAMGMYVYGDTAVVRNSATGDIDANVDYGVAYGIYSWGTISNTVTNDGILHAGSNNGDAYGVLAIGNGNVQIIGTSTSNVSVNANGGFATGLLAAGSVSGVDNAGTVSVFGNYGRSAGIAAFGDDVTIGNSGHVDATGGKYSQVAVIGLLGSGAHGDVAIDNTGTVGAHGGTESTGILGEAYVGNVTVTNAGIVQSGDGFTPSATGIYASTYDGDVSIDNSNSISVGGTFAFPLPPPKYGPVVTTQESIGAYGFAVHGNAAITNSGTVDVLAAQYGAGLVSASIYGDASVANTGTVHVTVDGDFAIGLGAHSDEGHASVVNGKTVTVTNTYGVAVGAAAGGNTSSATNAAGGTLSVTGEGGAIGLAAQGNDDADVRNDGTVDVTQTGSGGQYGPAATGLLAYASIGDADVVNNGTVSVTAYDRAVGIDASAYGTTRVVNAHDITVSGTHGYAVGVMARDMDYANGDATMVSNSGAIHAVSQDSWAEGVFAGGENVNVNNALGGTIEAVGLDWAAGIEAQGDNVAVTNNGTLTANTSDSGFTYAIGIDAFGHDAVLVGNGGDLHAASIDGVAKGIGAFGYGTVIVNNTGDIAAEAGGYANGIHAEAFDTGLVFVTNTGDIAATSTANGNALGIYAYGGSVLRVDNTGDITASAYDSAAFAIGVYGVDASASVTNGGHLYATSLHGQATGMYVYGESATVANAGLVSAHGDIEATGIRAGAYGNVIVTGNGTIDAIANDYALGIGAEGSMANVLVGGSIHATADNAIGIRTSGNSSASVSTSGTVTASGIGEAIGVQVEADYSSFHNTSVITATTSGDDAVSAGAMAFGATASIANGGTLSATATGHDSQSIGAFVMGGDVSLANTSGSITSTSTYGAAVGALVGAKYGNGTVNNNGTITATGHAGSTIGVVAMSSGDLAVFNNGTIIANDAGYAIGLGLYADGTAVVTNTGTIVANSNLEGSVAIAGGDGIEDIRNAGMISGAMVLGDGDDVLTNQDHGTWIVRGHGTDFGGGDDHLVNAAGGTIVMNNAAISLGSHASAGNAFTNAGLVAINGDSSIDLGTGLGTTLMQSNLHAIAAAPVAVSNPLAFTNNGTISFLDGVPDDMLTIYGDFAGQGALNVDVSLLNQASDMLYIEGNVSDGTKQSLNVRVLDLPNSATGLSIPVVAVTGESKAGEFVAGTFSIDRVLLNANNFVNLKVGVTERINTANATADLFNLTIAMDGVNDTGALAGDIATGAQSLMTTQVGTFRQRMGVFSRMGDSDTGAWVRVFRDKGTITPEFTLDNMPQNGQFGFEQTNSGVEAGVNAYVTDGFFIGATLAKGEGKQSLDSGFGSDKLTGDTAGLYMTYLSPNGFYADVSYRWMHFDAELTSAGGRQDSGGDVGAFNVEAGWNVWTSASGLKLVPQAQYTRSEVSNVDILHGDLADFAIDGGTSSRGRVGLELEQTFKSASGATWTPYGALSVVREFKGEQGFTIADTFTGHTSTQGTSGMLEVGANVKMGNLDIFGGLNWTDGGAFDSILGGQLGLRYTW